MEMVISTVYALPMPKYVYVQVHGIEKPARIQADKIEREDDRPSAKFILRKGTDKVGEFNSGSVQGWWIQEEDT